MPLFFTLSGFIIHYVYATAFAAGWRRAGGQFAVARFSRIYPLYAALLAYFLVFTPMGTMAASAKTLPILSAYLSACWTWWPFVIGGQPLTTWYYSISWSVSTEIFFYVCYAMLLYRIARLRSLQLCIVVLITYCMMIIGFLYTLFYLRDDWEPVLLRYFVDWPGRTDDFTNSLYRWLLYISPYVRIFEFAGGVLTCQLFLLIRDARRPLRPIVAGLMAWVAIAATMALFAAFVTIAAREPWLAVGNHSAAAFFVELHMNFLFAPICYLMILSLAIGGSAVGRLLAARGPRFLGDISYSTYLSHQLATRILFHSGLDTPYAAPHLMLAMPVIYGLSWALYAAVEVPAKRQLRQRLEARLFRRAAGA